LFHSIVKEQVLPGQLEEQQTIANSTRAARNVNSILNRSNRKIFGFADAPNLGDLGQRFSVGKAKGMLSVAASASGSMPLRS
jgi:hypothetical protein